MMITKVKKVYQDDEKKWMKKEAKKQARFYLLLGKEPLKWRKMTCNMNQMMNCATWVTKGEIVLIYALTHHLWAQEIQSKDSMCQHKETQAEPLNAVPSIPELVPAHGKKISVSSIIEIQYLEAMVQLTSENSSASEAIKAVHTVDTVVWGQQRHLLLRYKNYMNAFKALKKWRFVRWLLILKWSRMTRELIATKFIRLQLWMRMFKICWLLNM